MPNSMTVFDRRAVRMHRDRATGTISRHDFLLREIARRLIERLEDVKRDFPAALDLGCHTGELGHALRGHGKIGSLVCCDLSPAMVSKAPGPRVAADEEALPFKDGSFDLIVSLLSLHWVNDLPGTLLQVRSALKPDGLFLGAMLGGQTLKELRHALAEAEIAAEGGLSPRISPFADVRDAGDLLQRAGFALPVADTETLTVVYPEPLKLMADLRGMGETNATIQRRKSFTRRATLLDGLARYRSAFANEDDTVPATFQIIYLSGWSPHESQPKPLPRGSARTRLADALNAGALNAGALNAGALNAGTLNNE